MLSDGELSALHFSFSMRPLRARHCLCLFTSEQNTPWNTQLISLIQIIKKYVEYNIMLIQIQQIMYDGQSMSLYKAHNTSSRSNSWSETHSLKKRHENTNKSFSPCPHILCDFSHDLKLKSLPDCGAPRLMLCHPSLTQGGLQLTS